MLSLTARGLTTGEITAHFDEVYGAKVSKDTISRITEKVTGELAEWSSRTSDPHTEESPTMNPVQELITNFQSLVAHVPEIVQPFIVMPAGAVPFIEGEVAAMIGIVGGVNPIVAAIAAAAGNVICVVFVVLLTSRARAAVVNRGRVRVGVTAGEPISSVQSGDETTAARSARDAQRTVPRAVRSRVSCPR